MKTKKCTKCHVDKPMDFYDDNKFEDDGKQHRCKLCRAKYYTDNRKSIRDYQYDRYHSLSLDEKETLSQYNKVYYIKNKDRIKAYQKKYQKQKS